MARLCFLGVDLPWFPDSLPQAASVSVIVATAEIMIVLCGCMNSLQVGLDQVNSFNSIDLIESIPNNELITKEK